MGASAEIARAQKRLLTDTAALETLNKKQKSVHKLSGKKRIALRKQIATLQTKIAAERLAFERMKMRQMMTPYTHLQMAMTDIRTYQPTAAPNKNHFMIASPRVLLFTPQDAALLLKRVPLLTPEDVARVTITPLDHTPK